MKKQMKLFTYLTKPFVLFMLLFAFGVGQMWGTARTFKSGEKIYFKDASGNITWGDLNCLWKVSNGNVYAYFWNDTESAISGWATTKYGTVNKENTIYEITVPGSGKEYTNVLFTRGDESNKWWNQTVDQTPEVGYNLFCIANDGDYDEHRSPQKKWKGNWSRYAHDGALIGEFNNWNPDTYPLSNSGVKGALVPLAASTTYKFKILLGETYYGINSASLITSTLTTWWTLYSGQGDLSVQTDVAGDYGFAWNASSKNMTVYYPKALYPKNKYIYFDVRNETYWNANPFTARFYLKYFDSGSNLDGMPLECSTPIEENVYYAVVPDNGYIGQIQMNRWYNGGLHGIANVAYVYNRSTANQNCLKEESGKENYEDAWTPQWTTYCPPMSDVDLEEDGTTLSWGGDGSSGTPYLIPTGASIKVKATNATKAVDDDNMTIYYQFKKAGTEVQAGSTTASATITASGSTGTKEAVTVEAYNYYNSTSGTHLASNEIYYEVRTPYTISYNAGTGGSGLRASETKLKGVNFATPNSAIFTRTGYTQTGWATSNGGSQLCALGGNYTSDADATLYPVWTANNYTVTLDNREADIEDGTESVSVTFDAITGLTSTIDKPEKKHYDFGGYYTSANSGATLDVQLIDESGNWKKGVSGYTGTSGDNATWVYAGDITLYAKWTEHEYAVTLAISPAGAGTTSPASSTTAKYVTASADITATPSTGYSFREWGFSKTDEKYDVYVSDDKTYSSTDATIKINAQHNGTLTANFTPITYTVRFENLGADAGHKGSLDTTVTFNDTIHMKGRIEVPSKAHYEFGGYYISTDKGATLTNTQIIDANGNWNKAVSGYTGTKDGVASWVCAGDTVLYAKWTEIKHTVNVAVSPEGAGSVQVNSSNVTSVTGVGIATKSAEMTPIALAGWKFKEWQVTSNLQMDLVNYHSDYQQGTANKMKINATADDQTITAVFEPRYYLVGKIWDDSADGGMPGWDNYNKPFKVVTTSPVLDTCKLTLITNKSFYIEVRDKVDGFSYGKSGGTLNDNTTLTFTDKDNKVFVYSNGGTEYTFKITGIDGNGRPQVSVERPYQVNIGRKRVDIDGTDHDDNTGGTVAMSLSVGGDAVANGAWVPYGTSVKYDASKQTGYTVDWYNASDYETWFSNEDYWFHTATSTGNGYAKFTEKATTVTLAAANGKIQIGGADKTSTTVGITTTRSLTAVPNDGYYFTGWSLSSSPDFQLDDKESDTDSEVTLRGKGDGNAGTLTANFTLRYSLKGTMNSENWGTDHYISNIATVGGKAIGYVDITLAANTSYEFAIYDLGPGGGWLKDNNTQVYNMTNGNSYNWDFDLGRTYNCGITTAGAGTYRFMWNITDKTMSVIYPNFVIYRTGDKDEDSESASHTTTSAVESYAGGTINQGIEFRMKVPALDTWYTLCLPFTVSAVKVWDEADGAYYDIYPYYRSGGKYIAWHYIIRTPKTATDLSIAEFDDWDDPTEKAFLPSENTPYIIQWHDSYFTGKYISFFGGTGQTIPTSMTVGNAPSSDNVVNVHGNDAMKSGTIRDAYLLENDYGTYGAWLREDIGTDRTILPFECYIRAKAETAARYRVLRRDMTIDDTPTGLDQIINRKSSNRKFIKDGQLFIIRDDKMYNVYGMEVQQ